MKRWAGRNYISWRQKSSARISYRRDYWRSVNICACARFISEITHVRNQTRDSFWSSPSTCSSAARSTEKSVFYGYLARNTEGYRRDF